VARLAAVGALVVGALVVLVLRAGLQEGPEEPVPVIRVAERPTDPALTTTPTTVGRVPENIPPPIVPLRPAESTTRPAPAAPTTAGGVPTTLPPPIVPLRPAESTTRPAPAAPPPPPPPAPAGDDDGGAVDESVENELESLDDGDDAW
jgi:hypothetical protein